jgi:transglutaminase-like putative cysteine protease
MPMPRESLPRNSESASVAAGNQIRLKLSFAILSCLGGLVLASGEGAEVIPLIAVFFAVFGFVFVDWLKLFSLPPVAAYILMGIAAIYCVSDFWHFETPGNQQMLSVARLLVFVQAILMLQKKTPRIFEQLGVFCLLELVVAAVFNDAIVYGFLLVPIGLLGAWALAMLASVSACEGLDPGTDAVIGTTLSSERATGEHWRSWLWNAGTVRAGGSGVIRSASFSSVGSMALAVRRMRRYAIMTLAPAITLIAAVFFYVIPRTTDAARMEGKGNVLVGFSDTIHLEQIGEMLQSTEPAVRVRLSDRLTARPYLVDGGVYLRGQVLEEYRPTATEGKLTATWSSAFAGSTSSSRPLPREYFPARKSDRNFYDSVLAEITCEATGSRSLFSIAPYFRVKAERSIVHADGRWLIARRRTPSNVYSRMRYVFGTNAFRDGVQTDMIAATQPGLTFSLADVVGDADLSMLSEQVRSRLLGGQFGGRPGSYLANLLRFDESSMPTIAQRAADIRGSIPSSRRTDLDVAKAFERHLSVAGGYQYTLSLDAAPVPGMDPIEQFMAIDRRGHCQYFASALTMMLRSVNIPARIVVGYRTDEYSEIGQYYLARQNHAHAWVEALIQRDQLGSDQLVYGQPEADQYWIRFDPTPGGGGADRTSAGGVETVFNLAKNMWEEYVVDMDASRQNQALSADGDAIDGSYGAVVRWVQQKVAAIRAGGLGGGSLALRDVFSWRGAAIAVILATVMLLLLKLRLPTWSRRQANSKRALVTIEPRIAFYSAALDQLARLGIKRAAMQTPSEFSRFVAARLQSSEGAGIMGPLTVLTDEFCRQRYGGGHPLAVDVDAALAQLSSEIDSALSPSTHASRRPRES